MSNYISKAYIFRCIAIHKQKLGQEKEDFVRNVLEKHGPKEALTALYVCLYIVKSVKELLSFNF